jgi:uncharacterized membrane protein YhaH (DUF805 family)
MSIIKYVFANTLNYSGRARRKEYWLFALFYLLFAAVFFAVDYKLGWFDWDLVLGPLTGVWALFTFPTNLAVTVRRLHDSGKSGWWYLIFWAPLVGPFIMLGFMLAGGTHGDNEYGPDPLGRESKIAESSL